MPLTQDRMTAARQGQVMPYAVAAGANIFLGALVVVTATGFAQPGSTATGLTYIGRADQHVDNTGGADGDETVLVRRKEAFLFANSTADPVGQASVGKPCYILDDETVAGTDATGTRSPAGTVLAVESNGVWVDGGAAKDLSVVANLDFPSIAASGSEDLTIAVQGASVGDAVSLGLPSAPSAGIIYQAWASAIDMVSVRATNITAGAIDPVVAGFRVTIHKA